MPHRGDLLGDRYRLDDRIAAGGMGEVWQATDTVLGRDVAVKTLHPESAADTGFRTRFRNEARAMAVLHHPGVADVYDYGHSGPDAYIVMARVHGEPLHQRLAERGRLTPAETMSVVAQAGRALEAAHLAGIVHRDVKPGNLIIEPDGTVVLVDFGVARTAGSPTLTNAKEVVGTALYIAPEQLSKSEVGPAADVYALGAVAYHCLAGHPPFVGPNPVTVAMMHLHDIPPPLPADVPDEVRALVTRAMAKDPAERFPSAAAVSEAAEQALAGTTTSTRTLPMAAVTPPADPATTTVPVTPGTGTAILPAPAGGGARRKRTLLLSALAAVILGTAAAVFALVNPHGGGGTPAPAQSASVRPSASQSPGGKRGAAPQTSTRKPSARTSTPSGQTTAPTSPAPAGTTTPTPAPSRAPTTAPATTAPEETTATTAPASAGENG
jgi:serine/threonine-protein kinase